MASAGPRRHAFWLSAIDSPGCGDDAVALGWPLDLGSDLLQDKAIAVKNPVDNRQRGKCRTFIRIACGAREDEVREAVDADQRPGQNVVNGATMRQACAAIEAVWPKRFCEGLAHGGQCGPVAAEQVARHVRYFFVKEFVHVPHIVDPHDLQRRFEQSRQTGQAEGDPGFEDDRVIMERKLFQRHVLTEKRIVVEERIAHGRAGEFLQARKRLFSQSDGDFFDSRLERFRRACLGDVQRKSTIAGVGLRPQCCRSLGDPSPFSGSHLDKVTPLERANLRPIQAEDPLGQVRNRHPQDVVGILRQVLDAMLEQCHQGGKFVGRVALPGLQYRHDAQAEEKRIGNGIGHSVSWLHPCHGWPTRLICTTVWRHRILALTGAPRVKPVLREDPTSLQPDHPSRYAPFVNDRVRVQVSASGVATVTMVRAHKHNALDRGMFEGLVDAAAQLSADNSVRAIVLHGEGKSFCSGLDIASFMSGEGGTGSLLGRQPGEIANLAQHVSYDWSLVPAPVIAAIHGNCFGGGLQIALGADIRIAAPDAKLSILEMKWGLIPDMGITQALPRLLPIDVAKELTYTGRVVSGSDAAALGLVTRSAHDPLAAALALAEEIAEKSPDAVRSAKRLYNQTWVSDDVAASLELESDLQTKLIGSPNQMAAVMAGMTGDKPVFANPE